MEIGAFASFFAPSTPPQRLLKLARQLDAGGFDSLWFGEHILLFDEMEFGYPGTPDGRLPVPEGDGIPDQSTIISYLTGHTENLRFGTGISLIPQRNPIYTAKEFATLDWLSGGRVDLGVGVGWCKEEVLACGYAWENRGARCDEALDLITQLWTQPETTFHGEHFQVQGARFDPKPVQNPHVPLIIGGYSDAAMRRTARFGQGWLGFGLDPKSAQAMLARLDDALAAAGRDRSSLSIVMMPAMDDLASAEAFAELGVDRLVPMVSLEDDAVIDSRLEHLSTLQSAF